ncbi:purine-nucleoside phosphorylase [Brumimicrobium salinarum]|uniref:Purine nucleoside phosphorylase n=1 Tax=Brumimicrobium salinarum TaxID=2058658 RepID=A0A2I0QZN0_9FLAO|nr:purine-nucleoside phosphorylase [Brumimicrobium salinarum]PKR79786.1 purine-nucleoside phosphorylase [Brumimicrobium salinarum]
MLNQINETVKYLQSQTGVQPKVGVILGTGLGGLVNEIEIINTISYEDIPNFPVSTVEGHSGRLIFGKLGGKEVMAMQGRFHFYEGYTLQQCTFPVRVMNALGVERLIVSNASGGVNPAQEIGEIMIINDHINLFPGNPLIGKNIDELGPRFPDMSDAYDAEMIKLAEKIADELDIKVSQGVYAGLTGPTLETPAEYKMINILGADAVGMSTVPEVIVARHMEIPCFAVSIITDLGVEGKIVKVSAQDVIDVANEQEPKMTKIITELIARV